MLMFFSDTMHNTDYPTVTTVTINENNVKNAPTIAHSGTCNVPSFVGVTDNIPPSVIFEKENEELVPLNICIDWLTCSFTQKRIYTSNNLKELFNDYAELFKILKINTSVYEVRKKTFYEFGLLFDEDIYFFVGGPTKAGASYPSVLLDMSGGACRKFDRRYPDNVYEHYFELSKVLLKEPDLNISRFDTPIDDFIGEIFPYSYLKEKIRNCHLVTTARHVLNIEKSRISDGTFLGISSQIGSRESDEMIEVYDKNLERKVQGYLTYYDYHYRFEYRTKNGKAMDLFLKLYDVDFDLTKVVPNALLNFLQFKQRTIDGSPTNDKSRHHWDLDKKWINFLQTAEAIKLSNASRHESTISVMSKWYERSVSKTDLLLEIADNDIAKNFKLLAKLDAIERLKSTDLAKLNNYYASKGEPIIDVKNITEFKEKLAQKLGVRKIGENLYENEISGEIIDRKYFQEPIKIKKVDDAYE